MLTATRKLVDGVLAAAIAAGKILVPTAVFVRPYTAGPSVDPPSIAAHFTFPSATAFNAQAVATWGAVQYLLDGRSCLAGPAITFVPASSADSTTVIGFAVGDDSIMTNILAWEPFLNPIALVDEHHPLTIVPRICLDPTQGWGSDVVING